MRWTKSSDLLDERVRGYCSPRKPNRLRRHFGLSPGIQIPGTENYHLQAHPHLDSRLRGNNYGALRTVLLGVFGANRKKAISRFLLCLAITALSVRCEAAQNQQNQGAGVTVQLPTLGVEIDANGVLSLSVTDPSGKIRAERAAAARQTLSQDIQKNSDNRKISLRRLADAISKSLDGGHELDTEIVHLAGLRRLEHVFLYPEDNDIIISGPAGGWLEEPSGRVVGLDDRQPLVLLDDLVTALCAFGPSDALNKVVLCSIDPTAEGLERYKKLKGEIPIKFTAAQWAELPARMSAAMRESLGPSNVRVHGVLQSSHIAQVMVESDYRMKMIGVGLEPEPISMVTFIEAIDRPIGGFQQWWLRPKYDRLVQDPEEQSLKITGQTIELVTDRLEVTAEGRLVASKSRTSAAATKYASEFTKNYGQIAVNCPVFLQLQTISDLLVVAGWLKKTDAWRRVAWDGGVLLDAALARKNAAGSKDRPVRRQCRTQR